jgi:hypothetical protein
MQFTSAARRWFQSVERELMKQDWPNFCRIIRERFCRYQHELFIRQMFHIRQTTTVQDYVDRFIDLIEQLLAYTPNPDHLSYTTRFIDGLRDDIRAIILVQRPPDLDTACTLALLQEEAIEPGQRHEVRRTYGFSFTKHQAVKGALPLPPPLAHRGAPVGDDKKLPEERRGPLKSSNLDDKMQTLRNYRKARGLCVRCGERWQPGHKCAPVLQLHALQEVWNLCQDAFEPDNPTESSEMVTETATAQLFLLSAAAVSSQAASRTIQLKGIIGGIDILILVDSGSSNSVLNNSVAAKLPGISALASPVKVQVADGTALLCSQELKDTEWSVQGYTFHSTLKVLPLGSYDMIVGIDWLEAFSPMKVHWQQKWMLIPYGSTDIASGQPT